MNNNSTARKHRNKTIQHENSDYLNIKRNLKSSIEDYL
jgi:hypothetical protein